MGGLLRRRTAIPSGGRSRSGGLAEASTPSVLLGGGGWWRRNRWGLIALVPILGLTGYLNWGNAYQQYWKNEPREPINPGSDGWVSFAGARMRLVSLEPATDLHEGYGDDPYLPPGGTAVWKAVISFDTTKPDGLGGCQFEMEDTVGHRYGADPPELTNTDAGIAFCTPSFEDEKAKKTQYEQNAYFITPSSAKASAIRISLLTKMPRYAHLTR